jgi:hypothetical protein
MRSMREFAGWLSRVRWRVASCAPLVAAIVFVRMHATAMPLTDEWCFLKSVMSLQGVDVFSPDGLARITASFPARFGEHWVIVPFLYYWPVAQWAHFDSRWLVYTTVAAFAVQALIYRRYLVRSSLWALPIALVLFCPSHYMEFLWGWQFTLAFSVVFALTGLIVISRMRAPARWRAQIGYFVAGVFCLLLATLSSAGGFFGFPCALLLVALQPMRRRARVLWLVLISVATVATYAGFMWASSRDVSLGIGNVTYVCTALGATIVGSPVDLHEFGFDLRSATGFVLLACAVSVCVRSVIIGAVSQLSLALSVMLYGLLCLATIGMAREYLGNWHLQYALPAVCGAYASAYVLWKLDRSVYSAVPCFVSLAVLSMCLIGWINGFIDYGPSYHAYILKVEDHARRYLQNPLHPRPYPPPMDLDADMLLFLSAEQHPVFGDSASYSFAGPLPDDARVFVDGKEFTRPLTLSLGGGLAVLTVTLPARMHVRGVMAGIGESRLLLRRVHPDNTKVACCAEPGVACYSGMLVGRLLGKGLRSASFYVAN